MSIDAGSEPAAPLRRTVGPAPAGRLRIAMALYADVTHDSRVQREAAALADAGHDVTIYCLAGSVPAAAAFRAVVVPAATGEVVPGPHSPFLQRTAGGRLKRLWRRMGWLTGYVRGVWGWGRRVVRTAGPVDAWLGHDLPGLAAVGLAARSGVPIVFDSHELFLETGSAPQLPRPFRALLRALQRRLVARSAGVVTINEGIADELRRTAGAREVVVVRNCPSRWDPPEPRPDLLRSRLGIPAGAPIVLFHGSLVARRGIEGAAAAIRRPELAAAHLVLLGNGELGEPVLRAAAGDPDAVGRIHVLPAVPIAELLPWVASADLGIVLPRPLTKNLYLSTPNKLFECLAAGTPVIASDFPELRRVVGDPGGTLGAVCDPEDPAAVAAGMARLLGLPPAERDALRARCLEAAHARYNWETEAAGLVDLFARIAARQAPARSARTTVSLP